MSNANTIDQIIDTLRPGQEAEISRRGDIRCTVERSGDGRTIRFVRHRKDGFEVFRTAKW